MGCNIPGEGGREVAEDNIHVTPAPEGKFGMEVTGKYGGAEWPEEGVDLKQSSH